MNIFPLQFWFQTNDSFLYRIFYTLIEMSVIIIPFEANDRCVLIISLCVLEHESNIKQKNSATAVAEILCECFMIWFGALFDFCFTIPYFFFFVYYFVVECKVHSLTNFSYTKRRKIHDGISIIFHRFCRNRWHSFVPIFSVSVLLR